MAIVALSRDNIVANLIRRFGSIGSEYMREAIGHILLIARMIGIDAHLFIEIKGRVRVRHEWAIDGHSMQVHTDTVVLRIAVDEHPELLEWVHTQYVLGVPV
jgi:hypothetical protein